MKSGEACFIIQMTPLPGRTLKELFLSTRDVLLTNPSRGHTGARPLMRAWRREPRVPGLGLEPLVLKARSVLAVGEGKDVPMGFHSSLLNLEPGVSREDSGTSLLYLRFETTSHTCDLVFPKWAGERVGEGAKRGR